MVCREFIELHHFSLNEFTIIYITTLNDNVGYEEKVKYLKTMGRE